MAVSDAGEMRGVNPPLPPRGRDRVVLEVIHENRRLLAGVFTPDELRGLEATIGRLVVEAVLQDQRGRLHRCEDAIRLALDIRAGWIVVGKDTQP